VELKELRSLVALSELGNISRVAERLHLSPPAIHKQLKTLEDELGVMLYERVGKELRLAQAASVLLPYMQEILVQYDSAFSALEEWKGLKHGQVRIGAGPSGCVLPTIIRQFEQAYPGVEVQVEAANTSVLLEDLQKGLLDLALIVSSDLRDCKNFRIEATWGFDLALVCSPEEPDSPTQLADLNDRRFILFRQGSRLQEPIDRYFSSQQFEPKVVMRFDNANFIRDMVRSRLGIAFLPLWVVEQDLKEGKLRIIKLTEEAPVSKLALIRRKSNYAPPSVKGFIKVATGLHLKDFPLLSMRKSSRALEAKQQ
jgi:DNA-binding transcriptional LysR family regulator